MNEYLFFMHDDALRPALADDGAEWERYIAALRATGQFEGGSAIGGGILNRKGHGDRQAATVITGYIKVRASDLEAARLLLNGNPTYEAGGTVEVRELTVSG